MSTQLFTSDGHRLYLNAAETAAFIEAANAQERPEVRTFALTMAYTGCRISEALALTVDRVDMADKVLTFQSLKKRGKTVFRSVPVPDGQLDALELVHRIRTAQKGKDRGHGVHLWPWGRTTAWKHITRIMAEAGVIGAHATPKGLRHGFGIRMADKTRNPRLVQKWLGHSKMETTAIYMDAVGSEERSLAVAAWES